MEKEMIKQREENGACSSYPESRKNSNEVQMKFCQSCGMPLTDDVLGTNADGSKNEDYCMYCYKDGKFLQDCTMEEMIEHCAQFVGAVNEGLEKPITKEEYRYDENIFSPVEALAQGTCDQR